MSSAYTAAALAALFPAAVPHVDYRVVADEAGNISIDPETWNTAKLGPLDAVRPNILAKGLECAKLEAVGNIRRRAAKIREEIAETDDPIQIAAWANKAAVARRIAGGIASPSEIAALTTEAAMRGKGETLAQLCGRILIWSEIDAAAASMADAAQKQAEHAINSAPSIDALPQIMTAIQAQVAQLMTQLPSAPADMVAASEARFAAEPKQNLAGDVASINAVLKALNKAVQ